MREILFKAKRLDDEKWVEGNVFFAENGKCEICIGTPLVRVTCEVDPSTVCQYTGLTDKNGAKIFESDIVHYQYEPGKGFWNVNQDCIVSFRGAGFHIEGIMGTNKYACMSGWLSQLPVGNGEVFEVIGNIHDKEADHED